MKSIISMSFGIGALITPAFGSSTALMEGAVGEVSASTSFFEREVNNAVARVKQAWAELSPTLQNIATSPQQDDPIKHLIAMAAVLERKRSLLASCKASEEQLRARLAAMPQNSDEESVATQ
jgi:hypothetical protein